MQAHGQEKQSHLILITAVLLGGAVVGAATAAQPVAEPNDLRWDLAGRFMFMWRSVQVAATIRNSAEKAEDDSAVAGRTLGVSGQIHILDGTDLVGLNAGDPTVLEVMDSDGKNVKWEREVLIPAREYRPLEYTSVPVFDPCTWSTSPMAVLVPHRASISLLLDPNQGFPMSLSLLRAYFDALYTDTVVNVDVPFAVSDGWIDVTPDLAIRVAEAGLECGLRHEYRTEVKCNSGFVQALETRLSIGEEVADYLVIETQLLDSQEDLLLTAPGPISPQVWVESVRGNPWGTATCSGTLTCPDCTDVALIRHIVAVHPREVRIPFELKNIPVPSVEPVGQ